MLCHEEELELVWAVAPLRLQGRKLELAEVVGALVGEGLCYGCIPLSYAGVVNGRVPSAKALASVEEFKEFLEEGLQQEKLVTPLVKKISVARPALPEPILTLLFHIAGPSICWGWASNGAEALIREWKLVDLAELQPQGAFETVQQEPNQKLLVLPACGFQLTKSRKKPIKDLSTWIQCFVVYLRVMSKKHPSAVPKMLAHMLTIIRAAQEFEDPAWILYDAAYRDKAAATKNHK